MGINRVFYKKLQRALLGSAFAMSLASPAFATIIYDTASTTNITSTVNDHIRVDNYQAVVNIGSGGVIRASAENYMSAPIYVRSGTVNIGGNSRVIASNGEWAINVLAPGLPQPTVRIGDQAFIDGGIWQGNAAWRDEATASKLYIQDQAIVNGDLRYSGYVRIEDQALINGRIATPDTGNMNLDMRGGVVTGDLFMGGYQGYLVNISGGSILGGIRGNSGEIFSFNMTGGYIDNGFRTSSYFTGTISGGRIDGGIAFREYGEVAPSNLRITGGAFDADAAGYLLSASRTQYNYPTATPVSFEISGGQWGYAEQGLGFFLDNWADLSIRGWDLSFVNGWLSGYLLDGSWFSNHITFGSNWHGTFNISNVAAPSVPEPSTLGLFLGCSIGAMFIRRRTSSQSV